MCIRDRDYTVQLISTDKIVEKNNISIWNDIGVRNVTNDNISEYYFNISNFINYLSCYNDRLKELQTELSMVCLLYTSYMDFSSSKTAASISEATGAETACLYSCHNVTDEQLKNGVTYLSLMTENYKTIKNGFEK